MASLNIICEECTEYEDAAKSSGEKLLETENLMEALQNELKLAQGKFESIEQGFKVSKIGETEIMENLKSAEAKLEKQQRIIEQATARNSELELLYESLAKSSKLKLRNAKKNFNRALEDLEMNYQEHVNDYSAIRSQSAAKLVGCMEKLVAHEETIDELKNKILAAETRAGPSSSKNKLLVKENLKLMQELKTHQTKINELQAAHMEMDVTAEQLDSHMKPLARLRNQHSRGLEIQSEADSCVRDAELQLQEAIKRFTQRDYDAQDLSKGLSILEKQCEISDELADEAVVTDSRKVELEEILLKLNHLESIVGEWLRKASQFEIENEGIAGANFRLTQELVLYENKISELQTALKITLVGKEEFFEQLLSSNKTWEDLAQRTADGQKLQSQVGASSKYSTVYTLKQQWLLAPAKLKESYLVYLLSEMSGSTSMVFTRTCEATQILALILRNLGLKVIPISGHLSQPKRLGALNKFKAGEYDILICTDVASRGLDIPPVEMVINYDIPSNSMDYIHRVSRVARAGHSGVAISLVDRYDVESFVKIEKLIGKKLPLFPCKLEEVQLLLEHVNEAKGISLMNGKESGSKKKRKGGEDENESDRHRSPKSKKTRKQ